MSADMDMTAPEHAVPHQLGAVGGTGMERPDVPQGAVGETTPMETATCGVGGSEAMAASEWRCLNPSGAPDGIQVPCGECDDCLRFVAEYWYQAALEAEAAHPQKLVECPNCRQPQQRLSTIGDEEYVAVCGPTTGCGHRWTVYPLPAVSVGAPEPESGEPVALREVLARAVAAYGAHVPSGARLSLDECCAVFRDGPLDPTAYAAADILLAQFDWPLYRRAEPASESGEPVAWLVEEWADEWRAVAFERSEGAAWAWAECPTAPMRIVPLYRRAEPASERLREALAQVANIAAHQSRDDVHPLTCAQRAGHLNRHGEPGILYPALTPDGAVVLLCPDCDYVQRHIPPFVNPDFALAAEPAQPEPSEADRVRWDDFVRGRT